MNLSNEDNEKLVKLIKYHVENNSGIEKITDILREALKDDDRLTVNEEVAHAIIRGIYDRIPHNVKITPDINPYNRMLYNVGTTPDIKPYESHTLCQNTGLDDFTLGVIDINSCSQPETSVSTSEPVTQWFYSSWHKD